MPCVTHDYPDNEHDEYSVRQIRKLKRILDETTQLLCFACGQMIYEDSFKRLASNRLCTWWNKHEANDRKRVYHEMLTKVRENWTTEPFNQVQLITMIVDSFVLAAREVHSVSDYHINTWFPELARKAVNVVYEERERTSKTTKEQQLETLRELRERVAKLERELEDS